MTANGRHKGDNTRLVAEAARGATTLEAAEAAGVSERTARRRLADQQVQREVEQARGQMLETLVGQLSEAGGHAARQLRGLLDADGDQVRLGACRAALEYLLRSRELLVLERRVAEVERAIERREGEHAW